jgi:hypothetical protein
MLTKEELRMMEAEMFFLTVVSGYKMIDDKYNSDVIE